MSLIEKVKYLLHLSPHDDPSLVVRDVAYLSGTDAHVNNKLNIFLPVDKSHTGSASILREQTSKPRIPIVVHVHGGGWVRGNRASESRGGPTVGRTSAQEGFVGVVVSYRLARISLISYFAWSLIFGLAIIIVGLSLLSWQLIAGYVAFMAAAYAYHFFYKARKPVNIEHMLDDIAHALVYVHEHIQDHCADADPEQIFLSGHSAGAHLVSLLALDPTYLQRRQFPIESIRGVVATSGIYSLANPTHASANNVRSWIFRILYSSNLVYPRGKQMKDYSPIEFIKEGDDIPPFLVLSARFDMGLEVDAKRFVEKFHEQQQSAEYYTVNATHGSIAANFAKNDARKHFFEFIRRHTTR